MTNNFTLIQGRALLGFLVFGSLIFTNCSSDDDAPPPPSPIVEEFEEVEELPPVVDPDPEVTEPETGEVAQSEETNSIIADILGAEDAGEVDPATEESLVKVGEVAAALSPEVTEVAQSLDEAAVDNLFDEEQELEGSLAELQEQIKALPEEVLALLPVISFTSNVEAVNASAVYKVGEIIFTGNLNYVAQTEGSCFELNRDAYGGVIDDLTAQKDENLAVVEANYARRVQEAETRYNERLAQHESDYAASKEGLKAVVISLLEAAKVLDFLGLTEMAEQTRLLALFYTVQVKELLEAWDLGVRALLVEYKEAELQTALELKSVKTAEVNAAFEASKAQAKALLDAALAVCHDQGSGN